MWKLYSLNVYCALYIVMYSVHCKSFLKTQNICSTLRLVYIVNTTWKSKKMFCRKLCSLFSVQCINSIVLDTVQNLYTWFVCLGVCLSVKNTDKQLNRSGPFFCGTSEEPRKGIWCIYMDIGQTKLKSYVWINVSTFSMIIKLEKQHFKGKIFTRKEEHVTVERKNLVH